MLRTGHIRQRGQKGDVGGSEDETRVLVGILTIYFYGLL